MMKHLRTLGAAAAALAASAALVSVSAPAIAQELAGAPQETPRLFEEQNRDWDRDRARDWDDDYRDRDRDRDYDRRRAPDFQYAQEQCSRAGIQEAWRRDYYSAQYDGRPRLEYGRYGWELRGRMRLHNSRGYSSLNTICDLRNGRNNVRFEFLR